jgi:chromosome segregation ATPase
MVDNDAAPGDDLAAAYQARNRQLREARMTMLEAVSTLTAELTDRREEIRALHVEVNSLREHLDSLGQRHASLEYELQIMQNMKVVRWSAPLRRFVRRLRDRER